MARRRRGKTEGGDGLGAAVERYRAAFGTDALPCLTTVTEEAVAVMQRPWWRKLVAQAGGASWWRKLVG